MSGIVYINGKFLAQRMTGVQRAAREWLQAMDGALASDRLPGERWVLLHPVGAQPAGLVAIEAQAVGTRGMPLHAWEQWTLPRAAREGVLLSLAGSSPWFGRRQVATLHDAAVWDCPEAYSWAFRLWYRALFRHQGRRALRLLTVSEFSRSRLADRLGQPARRIALLPNGADHLDRVDADQAILRHPSLDGHPFLLAVASANPSKNLARMIEAYGRLRVSDRVRLVMVGGGNASVFADAALPRAHGVICLGPVGDPSLKALYGDALALIQPSLYEGFGLPPLEAMSAGCPVAAARAAALPEVCGDAAAYFDPLSVDDIAGTMRRLIEDGALRERLRAAGHARVAVYSWRASGARLLDEVRKLT
jgi:glycosyltransferase involved in cell wall biosynthesis